MEFRDFAITDLFKVVRGKSQYTREYARRHSGKYPIYSAGRTAPLAHINNFDHNGTFLSWTTNGYAGYVQVLEGKFSINSDRGLLIPLDISKLSLDYCRLVLQPKLRSQAIGRIIDGKKNEYTKLSPKAVSETFIPLPITKNGEPDKELQIKLAEKYVKIESYKQELENVYDSVNNSSIQINLADKFETISIDEKSYFNLQIGSRILKKDILDSGIPIFSANVHQPFGYASESTLSNFTKASLIWGIDGIFDWNFIPSNTPFSPTDHCGVLNVENPLLDPEYIYFALRSTKDRYGFDRTYRASLENMKEVVTVDVPISVDGKFDLIRQREIAREHKRIDKLKILLLEQLETLTSSHISLD